ncbi:MAG: hypothetical protein QW567_04735 [Candidatus Hadarchaeales archaeon]
MEEEESSTLQPQMRGVSNITAVVILVAITISAVGALVTLLPSLSRPSPPKVDMIASGGYWVDGGTGWILLEHRGGQRTVPDELDVFLVTPDGNRVETILFGESFGAGDMLPAEFSAELEPGSTVEATVVHIPSGVILLRAPVLLNPVTKVEERIASVTFEFLDEKGSPPEEGIVTVYGVIHSNLLYFHATIDFGRGVAQYWLFTEDNILLDSGTVSAQGGSVTIPVGDYLGPGEHRIEITALTVNSSVEIEENLVPGYSVMKGDITWFSVPARDKVRIRLFPLSAEPVQSVGVALERNAGTVTEELVPIVNRIEMENRWPESSWLEWDSSAGQAKRSEIASRGHSPIQEVRAEVRQTGWELYTTVSTTSSSPPGGWEGYRVEYAGSTYQDVLLGYLVDRWEYAQVGGSWVPTGFSTVQVSASTYNAYRVGDVYTSTSMTRSVIVSKTYSVREPAEGTDFTCSVFFYGIVWGWVLQCKYCSYSYTSWYGLDANRTPMINHVKDSHRDKLTTYYFALRNEIFVPSYNWVCAARDIQVSAGEYQAHSSRPSSPKVGDYYYEMKSEVKERRYVYYWRVYRPVYGTVNVSYLAGERWTEEVQTGQVWRGKENLTLEVGVVSIGGYSGPVALSVVSPAGIRAEVTPRSLTLGPGENASATLRISLPDSISSRWAINPYHVLVRAKGGNVENAADFTLRIANSMLDGIMSSIPEEMPSRICGSLSWGNWKGNLSLGDTAAYEVKTLPFFLYMLPAETWSRRYSVRVMRWNGSVYVEIGAEQRKPEAGEYLIAWLCGSLEGEGKLVVYSPRMEGTRFDSQTMEVAESVYGSDFTLVLLEGLNMRPFQPVSNAEYLEMIKVPIVTYHPLFGKKVDWCAINPNSLMVRAFALNAAAHASTPEEAARNLLTHVAPQQPYYGAVLDVNRKTSGATWGWKMEESSSQCHWRSDGGIIWKARGDASDFANLYVSLCNSLGIPARRVHVVTEETDYTNPVITDGPFVQYAQVTRYYDAAEVNVKGCWQYCNPLFATWTLPLNVTIRSADAYCPSGQPIDKTTTYSAMVSSTQLPVVWEA